MALYKENIKMIIFLIVFCKANVELSLVIILKIKKIKDIMRAKLPSESLKRANRIINRVKFLLAMSGKDRLKEYFVEEIAKEFI